MDVTLKDKLNWHINNLVVHTSHGDFNYNSKHWTDPAHNVTVSSLTGFIFGKFAPNGNLKLQNEEGPIGCLLIPVRGRTFTPETISVSTVSGNIHVEAVWNYPNWPAQPYTHVTNIHTMGGELWAYIPHGSVTNLSSISSILATRLQPFGAASSTDQSEIYTYSGRSGAEYYVRIDDPKPESLEGRHNPLSNTISKHYLGKGTLKARYPYSWFGSMEAQIREGTLNFDSSALDEFERGEKYVKARKGTKGKSQLEVQVGEGELNMLLGL